MFESRTRQVVDNVLTVASAYMQEHARVLRADLISIATSLDAAKPLYDYEPTRFENLVRLQASLHGLQSAYLLDKNANVILRTDIDPTVKTVMPTWKQSTRRARTWRSCCSLVSPTRSVVS